MSFSVSYSLNIVCITPQLDAILIEKSGRGFSGFYLRDIKAFGEERGHTLAIREVQICLPLPLPLPYLDFQGF